MHRAATAAAVIAELAAKILKASLEIPRAPNFFLSPDESICACNAAAPAFAAASPAAPNGCMSASDRAMLAANEHADIFTGVFVSLAEWNPRVAKVAIEKNGNPATAAITTGVQISTSRALNTPHWKSTASMSGAKAISPKVAGTATASVIRKPLAYSRLCSGAFSDAFSAESLGKNTVAMAIVNTPSGNSSRRLARYSAGIAASFSSIASILETKMFTCIIAAPASAGRNRA